MRLFVSGVMLEDTITGEHSGKDSDSLLFPPAIETYFLVSTDDKTRNLKENLLAAANVLK